MNLTINKIRYGLLKNLKSRSRIWMSTWGFYRTVRNLTAENYLIKNLLESIFEIFDNLRNFTDINDSVTIRSEEINVEIYNQNSERRTYWCTTTSINCLNKFLKLKIFWGLVLRPERPDLFLDPLYAHASSQTFKFFDQVFSN